MEPNQQLQAYFEQCYAKSISDRTIVENLRQSGWDKAAIQAGLEQAHAASKLKYPHKIRNGFLWLVSPFIIMVVIIVGQLLIHVTGAHSIAINVLSIIGGIGFVILLPVGLVKAILTWDRK